MEGSFLKLEDGDEWGIYKNDHWTYVSLNFLTREITSILEKRFSQQVRKNTIDNIIFLLGLKCQMNEPFILIHRIMLIFVTEF